MMLKMSEFVFVLFKFSNFPVIAERVSLYIETDNKKQKGPKR